VIWPDKTPPQRGGVLFALSSAPPWPEPIPFFSKIKNYYGRVYCRMAEIHCNAQKRVFAGELDKVVIKFAF
jgi:hypothetical protein